MDRIQFRRDTLDNWNSVNPILLEGEIGYVLDDPNLYKMGDGVHTWDQLPFRGFDGTIVQETGSNENAVMSQKATSEAIYAVCGKLRTTSNLLKLSDFSKVSATRELGLLLPNGTVTSHNSQYVSSYIEIEANCEYYAILPNTPDWAASLAIYDSSYNPIYVAGGGSGNPIPSPFELLRFPGNAKYIRFFWTYFSAAEGDIYIYKCNKALGVTYDSTATKNSTNYINSGAVFESITKSNPELFGFESLCRNIEDFEIIDPNKVNGLLYKDGRILESTAQKVSSLIEIDVVNYDYVSNVSPFANGAEFASIVVYDADENIIAIYGGDGITSPHKGCLLKLPTTAKYIRHFATWSSDYILKAQKSAVGFDNVPTENSHNLLDSGAVYTVFQNSLPSGKKVLWLGTSIPEGSPYPQNSCINSGYTCINKAIGSSHLEFYAGRHSSYTESSGRFLTATVAELEALYRPDVERGLIQESWLTNWKNGSYENIVLPYINGTNSVQVDAIVIDHGINDGATIVNQINDKEHIDWSSDDRSTFTGAFKYLVDKIWAVNPNIRIIVCGYFEDEFHKITIEGKEYNMSKSICEIQSMIAEHYNFPIMKGWEVSGISNRHVPNSASYIQDNYIDEPPKIPGNYYPRYTDDNGNITIFQYYCPDGLHPHSDKTNRSAERLTLTYTKLLKNLV